MAARTFNVVVCECSNQKTTNKHPKALEINKL